MIPEHYPLQYLRMLTILEGLTARIRRSRLTRLLPKPDIHVVDVPEKPKSEDVIFQVDGERITWGDLLNGQIPVEYEAFSGSRPKRRFRRILMERDFRWLVRPQQRLLPQTPAIELSRRNFDGVGRHVETDKVGGLI